MVGNGYINETIATRKKSLLGEVDIILRGEEIHWKQKAKCKWLKEGDHNTKFFHKVAYGKNRKSLISRMFLNGTEVFDVNVIKDEAICFFSKLYSKEAFERPIFHNLFANHHSEDCVLQLECSFMEEEVKDAMFSMDNDKSPGPNGFSILFYQVCWEIVRCDIMKVFVEFFWEGGYK